MASSNLDPLQQFRNLSTEETTADVWLDGSNFGPTTGIFGLQYRVKWAEFQASFYVGRGGNNTRPIGGFRFRLSADFTAKTVLEAVLHIERTAVAAGIESCKLRYVNRPPDLRPQDVSVQLFRSPLQSLCWPGEPNHDEDVAAHLNPIICVSADQARADARKREAVAALCAEWSRLHPPVYSPHELRFRKLIEKEREEMKGRSLPLIRVNDLARELGVKSKLILDAARLVSIRRTVRHSDSLGTGEAEKIRSYLRMPAVRDHRHHDGHIL
jgi:hypothetical protein